MKPSSFKRPSLSQGLPTHAEVFALMKARLKTMAIVDADGQVRTPLAALSATDLSDPTLALLEAWSATADIVGFYQDRILNEAYLTTAGEKRSLDILGRSVGFDAPAFISAATTLGVIVADGAKGPITLPAGVALQSTPATAGAETRIFETYAPLTAVHDRSRLRPRQVTLKPEILQPDSTSTLFAGTDLGLTVGGALLLVLEKESPQWVIVTLTEVSVNTVLNFTQVSWSRTLGELWGADGWPDLSAADAASLSVFGMQLTTRLFGYNAPDWKKQPFSVQIANTPSGHDPFEYDDWPDFGVTYDDLPLQTVYPKVVPGSKLVVRSVDTNLYTEVDSASLDTIAEYGLSGQITRVHTTPRNFFTRDIGHKLQPGRYGHTATALSDGVTVVIIGGTAADGSLLSNIELFNAQTQLLTLCEQELPKARTGHSATLVGDTIIVIGGEGDTDWPGAILEISVGKDGITVTPQNGSFDLPSPRKEHEATLLPSGNEVLISGGVDASGAALASVLCYHLKNGWGPSRDMLRPRVGHSATLCPVFQGPAGVAPPQGAATVVFACGWDKETYWNDVEVFDITSEAPSKALFPLGWLAAGRAFHRATAVAGGILLTGGETANGVTAECWTIFCQAYWAPRGAADKGDWTYYGPVPVIARAAATLSVARSRHVAVSDGDGTVVILGGSTGAAGATQEVEQLQLVSSQPTPPRPPTPPGPPKAEKRTGASPASLHYRLPVDRVRVTSPTIPGGGVFTISAREPLPSPQADAAAALLSNDRVFLCGGRDDGKVLDAAFIYDIDARKFLQVGGPFFVIPQTMAPTTTTALADGTILLTGWSQASRTAPVTPLAWTYDPVTNLATEIGSAMTDARLLGTATLLQNGTVLLAGGLKVLGATALVSSIDIYDPTRRTFRQVGTLYTPRCDHTATLLPNGKVLLAGGWAGPGGATTSAELFDPATMTLTQVSTFLPAPVYGHAATRLLTGDVLITGGFNDPASGETEPSNLAVIYNTFQDAFAPLSNPMTVTRAFHTATRLDDERGRVLLTGGFSDVDGPTATAELFDPSTMAFTATGSMQVARAYHGAILAEDGQIMITGGDALQTVAGLVSTVEFFQLQSPPPTNGQPENDGFVDLTVLPILTPAQNEALWGWQCPPTPAYVKGSGIFFFGQPGDPANAQVFAPGVRYVTDPPPASATPRDTLVYAQSEPLALTPPIDPEPVKGNELELVGVTPSLSVGDRILVTGLAPFARCNFEMQVVAQDTLIPAGDAVLVHSILVPESADAPGLWGVTLMSGVTALISPALLLASAGDPPPPALQFMAGDGKDIGDVPAALVSNLPRSIQAEVAVIHTIKASPDGSLMTVTFEEPLEHVYDRTTMVLYGNVVDVTQGQTVSGEILGSGDASVPFQAFDLARAPLTRVADPAGQIDDSLEVRVDNVVWTPIRSLADAKPSERRYMVSVDTFGRGRITFGDGVHGARLPTGENNVTAGYRVGAGPDGDVPAQSLTKPPSQIAGISAVINPLAATGGVGAVLPAPRRQLIPNSTLGLDRVVTLEDVFTFARGYADVAKADLAWLSPYLLGGPMTAVLSIAGPNGEAPDPQAPSLMSLRNAILAAAAPDHDIQLLPYEPAPFNLTCTLQFDQNAKASALIGTAEAALRRRYGFAGQTFGQAVRASEIQRLLLDIEGIQSVTIDSLRLAVSDSDTAPTLPASPARRIIGGQIEAAQILLLNPLPGGLILHRGGSR